MVALVHAGGVVVAHLLLVGAVLSGRLCLRPGCRAERRDCARPVRRSGPSAPCRRDGIVLHPGAAGVLIEIHAGIDGLVDGVQIEAGICLGTSESVAGVWEEQKIAEHNRNTTRRLRIGLNASHDELSSRAYAGVGTGLGKTWAGCARMEREELPISNQTHYYKRCRQGSMCERPTRVNVPRKPPAASSKVKKPEHPLRLSTTAVREVTCGTCDEEVRPIRSRPNRTTPAAGLRYSRRLGGVTDVVLAPGVVAQVRDRDGAKRS